VTSNRDRDEDAGGGSRLRWLLGVLAVLAIGLVVVWWPGCRQYPAVTSKESLQLMKLLYAACNTRDTARLARVEQGVEGLARAGHLTAPEQEAFGKIIGLAKAGDWAGAEKASFKFAQDQVGQGHPAPEGDDHDHDHKEKSPKGKAGR
jgi:hypothetical protein